MTIHHRKIPVLPKRSVTYPIARKIRRSYPVGRKSFSRTCKGKVMTLTISTEEELPINTMARLRTTMTSADGTEWEKIPYVTIDKHTLQCKIKPKKPGLHSFRSEFSIDKGKIWFRDAVPDAWVMVDPPQVDSLKLYTLIPNISGNITEWKADLSRIKEMGFNAIHLLPLTKLDTSQSPYSANNLFDVDPSYLDKKSTLSGLEQLEAFIEEARNLKIKLCFDLVLNHVGIDSNISKQAPDWIVPDSTQPDGLCRAKYWCEEGLKFWDDLVLINYEHPSDSIQAEIWNYMIEYALFWAKYANETGGFVRFDNLHSSNPEFVDALTNKLHSKYPNVGIIAEYFADESIMLNSSPKWGLNLILATPWDYKFVPQLREYLTFIHRVSQHILYYMPVTSHDSGTPAQEFGGVNSTVPRFVAAALLGTGATGIVQGVEYGEKEKINFIGRRPKKEFPKNAMFGLFIGKVHSILDKYEAFRHGGNCTFVDNQHDAIIAAFRESENNQLHGFLVVCNFDIGGEQFLTVELSKSIDSNGSIAYTELLSEEIGVFESTVMEIKMPPSSAKIFMLKKV